MLVDFLVEVILTELPSNVNISTYTLSHTNWDEGKSLENLLVYAFARQKNDKFINEFILKKT